MTDSAHFASIYQEGIEAADQGRSAEDNPYPRASREALSWQSGFEDVEFRWALLLPGASERRRKEEAITGRDYARTAAIAGGAAALMHYLGTGFYKTLAAILAVGWICSYIYLGAYIIESLLGKRTVVGKAAERAFIVVGKASLLAFFVAWTVVILLDGTFW